MNSIARRTIAFSFVLAVPSYARATECAGSFESWSCFAVTLGIIAPLALAAWVVAVMLSAAVLADPRSELPKIAALLALLTPATIVATVWLFEQLDTTGLWELLVGPALVFVEALVLARWKSSDS